MYALAPFGFDMFKAFLPQRKGPNHLHISVLRTRIG